MEDGLQNFKTPLLRIDDIMVLYDIDFCMLLGLVKTLLIFMIIYASQEMNDNSSSLILDTLIEIF